MSYDKNDRKLEYALAGGRTLYRSPEITPAAADKALRKLDRYSIPVTHIAEADLKLEPVGGQEDEMVQRLAAMPGRIKDRVIGQHAAADAVSRAVRRSFAGLKEDNKPVGSFLFTGPTAS